MNPEETAFVTYRRRKGRYTEDLEFEDIKLEDKDSDMDPTGIHSVRGKCVAVIVTSECIHLCILCIVP